MWLLLLLHCLLQKLIGFNNFTIQIGRILQKVVNIHSFFIEKHTSDLTSVGSKCLLNAWVNVVTNEVLLFVQVSQAMVLAEINLREGNDGTLRNTTLELLREWLSHLWCHLTWVWHPWLLTLELLTHWHLWVHATSWHSTSASSGSTLSSHVTTASLTGILLLILRISTWNISSLWEWLSTLVWLSWLCLRTNTHLSNTLNDLVKNLMNLSVFLGLSLLFDFVLG